MGRGQKEGETETLPVSAMARQLSIAFVWSSTLRITASSSAVRASAFASFFQDKSASYTAVGEGGNPDKQEGQKFGQRRKDEQQNTHAEVVGTGERGRARREREGGGYAPLSKRLPEWAVSPTLM